MNENEHHSDFGLHSSDTGHNLGEPSHESEHDNQVNAIIDRLWLESGEMFWVPFTNYLDEARSIEQEFHLTGIYDGLMDRLKEYQRLNQWYPETD